MKSEGLGLALTTDWTLKPLVRVVTTHVPAIPEDTPPRLFDVPPLCYRD